MSVGKESEVFYNSFIYFQNYSLVYLNRITLRNHRSDSDDFNPSSDDDIGMQRNDSQQSGRSYTHHRAIK